MSLEQTKNYLLLSGLFVVIFGYWPVLYALAPVVWDFGVWLWHRWKRNR